jgi:uncharacterized protein YqgC (DUF456 family)
MIEIILVIVAFLFLLAGLAGAVVPVLPGPPLSYVGLLLLQWSGHGGFSTGFLWLWAAITVAVTIGDYFLPALITRQFGGSRSATIGSILGLLAGLFFFPPIGLIIGPFLGAFAGELIHNRTNGAKALNVATGSFLAFILSIGTKLIVCAMMMFYAVMAMF